MELNGYMCRTTFWQDFSIADMFGVKAVRDTYKRAFTEWAHDYIYLTELVMVLNWKIFQWFRKDDELALAYNVLWETTSAYAEKNLKGDELDYYWQTTD